MNKKEEAKKILIHYFSLLFRKNNLVWDNDNVIEIQTAVDYIIEEANDYSRKLLENNRNKNE